jgi:signal transduction histidine kinase
MSDRPAQPEHWRLQAIRDLHDVLGSGITVIYVQAATALRRSADRPDLAPAALATIKATSQELASEVRAIVSALYSAETFYAPQAPPRRPSAGLDRIAALVEEMTRCGLAIELEVSGERPVPPAIDVAAYRIVQESLTNILRHAGPTGVAVRIRHEEDAVLVEITNARPDRNDHCVPCRGGHGIAGMRQRAEALGGHLSAEPLQDGGFRVQARLPTRTARYAAGSPRGRPLLGVPLAVDARPETGAVE